MKAGNDDRSEAIPKKLEVDDWLQLLIKAADPLEISDPSPIGRPSLSLLTEAARRCSSLESCKTAMQALAARMLALTKDSHGEDPSAWRALADVTVRLRSSESWASEFLQRERLLLLENAAISKRFLKDRALSFKRDDIFLYPNNAIEPIIYVTLVEIDCGERFRPFALDWSEGFIASNPAFTLEAMSSTEDLNGFLTLLFLYMRLGWLRADDIFRRMQEWVSLLKTCMLSPNTSGARFASACLIFGFYASEIRDAVSGKDEIAYPSIAEPDITERFNQVASDNLGVDYERCLRKEGLSLSIHRFEGLASFDECQTALARASALYQQWRKLIGLQPEKVSLQHELIERIKNALAASRAETIKQTPAEISRPILVNAKLTLKPAMRLRSGSGA